MKKKNIFLILGIIILILIITFGGFYFFGNKSYDKDPSKEENTKEQFFDKSKLIKDTYVTNDYENNSVYENTIYVPNFMTRIEGVSTIAIYSYKNDNYSMQLKYSSCLNEESLNSFIGDDKYINEDNYYYFTTSNSVKIYLKDSNNYWKTIELNFYSINVPDNSYKNLLKDLKTEKKSLEDYSIESIDGYFTGTLLYNDYIKEDEQVTAEVHYKVSSDKYNSNYSKGHKYQELYLDKTAISFYEGEITTDISSVRNQTRIRMFIMESYDLNLQEDAVNNLEHPLNQQAFKDVTKEDVLIEFGDFEYETNKSMNFKYTINYYKISSDKNNSHGERIYGYLPINPNLYYVIQIIGGENKRLDINMIKDFVPTDFVVYDNSITINE